MPITGRVVAMPRRTPIARVSHLKLDTGSRRRYQARNSENRKRLLKNRTAERSTQPPIEYLLIAKAVTPTIAPRGNRMRLGQFTPANRRVYRSGATTTKPNAGRICANVRVTCDANTASSAANWGGADRGGWISATARRRTTATEIAVQAQKPMRNKRQDACILGHTTPTRSYNCRERAIARNMKRRSFLQVGDANNHNLSQKWRLFILRVMALSPTGANTCRE
jgi:hypothetical protein